MHLQVEDHMEIQFVFYKNKKSKNHYFLRIGNVLKYLGFEGNFLTQSHLRDFFRKKTLSGLEHV